MVKGHHARLASQSEQFANELTRHLGVPAPDCRILRRVVRTLLCEMIALHMCREEGSSICAPECRILRRVPLFPIALR